MRWKNQYIDLINTKPQYILNCTGPEMPAQKKQFLFHKLAQHKDLIVELGSGSGGHLLELARRNPQALCLGFELRYKRLFRTAEKAEREGLQNLLAMKYDAKKLPLLLEPQSISAMYVNFPDPWSKQHWRKHRFLSPEFLVQVAGLLRTGAFFRYKTDQPQFFEETRAAIESVPNLCIKELSSDLLNSEFAAGNIRTEFEAFFLSKGLSISYLAAVKV
jgi:tRNA (guanine-N7-)-methyltransferase